MNSLKFKTVQVTYFRDKIKTLKFKSFAAVVNHNLFNR